MKSVLSIKTIVNLGMSFNSEWHINMTSDKHKIYYQLQPTIMAKISKKNLFLQQDNKFLFPWAITYSNI